MIHQTKEEKAFATLSLQAQLYIKLQEATTNEQKFIQCINYATNISQRKQLGKIDEITETNLKVIMRLIKSYLDSGVDPDSLDNTIPALCHVVTCPELVKLLLTRGANPDSLTHTQCTALHWVAMAFHSYYVESLFVSSELLAAAGANINAQDQDGKTPIEFIKKTFILSEDKINKIEEKFKHVTEHPRELNQIPTSVTDQSPYSDLQLTENDHVQIALYKDEKYKELINSDPVHNQIKSLFPKPFWGHERKRGKMIATFQDGDNASVIFRRIP